MRTLVESLPTRERGLKPEIPGDHDERLKVAPYAGAWIETSGRSRVLFGRSVAPYAGAWIETRRPALKDGLKIKSLPTRERGLKPTWLRFTQGTLSVAPYAGAWIETLNRKKQFIDG